MSKGRMYKKKIILKISVFLIFLFFPLFILLQILIISEFKDESEREVDYVIIPGARIYKEKPLKSLSERIRSATEYLRENKNIKVIVTGGQGKNEDISEAEAIKRELIKNNISAERIIVEDKSRNTVENFKYALSKIEREENVTNSERRIRILIVTNNYHLYRSKKIAELLGFEAYGLPAKTPLRAIPYSHIRESLSIIKFYLLKGKIL